MGRLNSTTSGGRLRSTSAGRLGSAQYDLTTSEGLSRLARSRGGSLAERAMQITGEEPSVFSKIGGGLKKGLGKVLDVAQRPNFAIAGGIKSLVDDDVNTSFRDSFEAGFTGETKHTFTDVFEEAGWDPTTRAGRYAKGAAGFAADILLDPTTYITFGAGAGVKVGTKLGAKTLTKAGNELLAKGVAQKAGQEFGTEFVKKAIVRMAESSPELYARFIDQGGIKFFGNTLISSGRIAGVAQMIPGMSKLDEATLPIRNTLGSLFNRDISATYGKLPQEFIDIKQRYMDLGAVRGTDALNRVIDIAKANKLTAQEAEIITDAIEAKLPLADARLENARKLIEQGLGRNLKAEQIAGIKVGELPNYVPHMLLDAEVKNIPFKPEGVRVSLGAAKERTIEGTVKEINERFGGEFFDPNVVNTAAIRSIASARAVSAAEFLRETAQKFGVEAGAAPGGYVGTSIKELGGLKFHPAIAEQVNNFKKGFIGDQATNNLLRAFDKAQGLWKASVTSVFPAFHGRNAISNVFLNFLDIGSAALSPARHFLSTTLLKDDNTFKSLERAALGIGEEADKAKTALKELSDKVILTDDFGKKWTFGELRTVIKDNRVAFGDEFTGFMDVRENIAGKLEDATPEGAVTPASPFLTRNLKSDEGFVGFKDISSKILDDLKGRSTVSKQFISDLTNNPNITSAERAIIRRALLGEGETVTVKNFANKVKTELLPLERVEGSNRIVNENISPLEDLSRQNTRYENISLPSELRGPVADYAEHIYGSPIKTSAGNVHFSGSNIENYFAHTRIEDLPSDAVTKSKGNQNIAAMIEGKQTTGSTRRVIELQSDLFQKGKLKQETVAPPTKLGRNLPSQAEVQGNRSAELAKLSPYENTWHERIIREEVRQAAVDGKTRLQFPTGETAMKIEGLGEVSREPFQIRIPLEGTGPTLRNLKDLTPANMEVRQEIIRQGGEWVITDVLGDGKFRAVQKRVWDELTNSSYLERRGRTIDDAIADINRRHESEEFDISGKIDKENPIYKFYEKEVGKYLKNAYGVERITDAQGVEWWQVKVDKASADLPVGAFGKEVPVKAPKPPKKVTPSIEQAQMTAPSSTGGGMNIARAVNPFSQDNIAFRAGRQVGNLIEQQARVLNFMTNLEKTGDVMTSAKRTKQFIFDYTNLSDFEKNVMRRLVPFYTFTRKNLELQVTQLAKQPGKLATQAKLFTSLSKTISGGTLTDKERSNLPQFLQEGLGIVVSRDKNNVQVINSVGSPIEQIFSNLKPNALLGSLSPILAVPLQVAIGKHFFFDRDLDEVNNANAYQNAPQFLKDYIGYTTRKNKDGSIRHIALNPTRLFILNNIPPSSRVVSTLAQIEEENVSGKLKIIRQLTGLKPYGADLDRQEAINEKNKIRELQDLLDEAGVAPIFRRSFIPK